MAPRLLKRGMVELFPQARRSPGKHVSTAIHKIMKAIHPDRFGERPIDMTRANLGNAMERAIITGLTEKYPERYCRPGELELDDWYGTPDLWDLQLQATTEIKLTWASLRRAEDIESEWFWRYWVQLKAYAHMAKMTKGQLYICFINGNYSRNDDDPDAGPTVLGWEEDFDPEDLLENWNMLKAQC